MYKKFLFILFVSVITFSCKKKQKNFINKKLEIPINKVQVKKSLLDTISTSLKKLNYELHPYSGFPLFFNNKNKDYYYAITVISNNNEIKDNWVFDELSFNEKVVTETKQYILKNEKSYNLVLLLIKDNIYEQDGVFSPSENFNYELYLKKNNVWVLKQKSFFDQDFFVFLDSIFLKEVERILK